MKKIGIARYLALVQTPLLCVTLLITHALPAMAAKTMSDYALDPLSLDPGVAPLVMLAMSNDHQLYFKAYTDYDDLNGNGKLDDEEITYDHAHTYVGYFEAGYCYGYANQMFSIKGEAVDGYCSPDGTQATTWSGNFLNWATMTRIDVLRKILYGGKRVKQEDNDTAATILERSYLPNDAHSFAKYYNGDDLNRLTPYSSTGEGANQGLTLCNTTLHTGADANKLSRTNTNPPLMRAVKGNHSLWAAGERLQCLKIETNEIPAFNKNKDNRSGEENYFIDVVGDIVENANDKAAAITLFEAKEFYPHLTMPSSQDEVVDHVVRVEACPAEFANKIPSSCQAYPNTAYRPVGLFQKFGDNDQLKWGLVSGSYEKNKSGGYLRKPAGFITDEIDANTGNFKDVDDGLIKNIDSLRIATWYWGAGPSSGGAGYHNTASTTDCPWGMSSFDEGKCNDWGNPLGEIMYESYRYLANKGAPKYADLGKTEESIAPEGVTIAAWSEKPLKKDNYCANLNVIGIETSAQSYDNGLIAAVGNDFGAANLSGILGEIKLTEDDKPKGLLVGSNGPNSDNQCTPKEVTSLEGVTGVCPEAPRLQGSWDIAALAKYVYDVGVDIGVTEAKKEKRKISTYGVSLSTALPSVSIEIPGTEDKINIVPACHAYYQGKDAGNCALVNFKVLSKSEDGTKGSFYVNWEDSEQGGDYDQDLQGIIDYELGSFGDGNNVKITSQIIGQSTDKPMAFGFVITGVENPGLYVLSGVNGYPQDNHTNPTYTNPEPSKLINIECKTAKCEKTDGAQEWFFAASGANADYLKPPLYFAAKNGNENPDNSYFNNNDPAKLETDLSRVLTDLNAKSAKGGSQVASTTKNAGANLFLHSFYYAQIDESVNGVPRRVNWIGQVGALFIDEQNRLREDTVANGQLDNGDLIITFDSTDKDAIGQPKVLKTGLATAENPNPTGVKATFKDIKYVWTTTRDAPTDVAASRNIKTSIPSTFTRGVDVVVQNNLQDFDQALFTGTNAANVALLGGYKDPAKLVDFMRGTEVEGLRSRTLAGKKYLLGDITNTSPIVASTSDYSFDTELGDTTYTDYKKAQAGKPIVVYTATNNGMIQAFHAGTYNRETKAYSGTSDDPLGKELWGYIPFNLLPHLQWLADPFYKHVPYFNGFMRTYDVKIFNPNDTLAQTGHVNGWGTILVVGTGLGGSNFPVTMGENTKFETRPAYIVLDVSDRLNPPKLIAEIAHDELGFTTGEPDVVRYQKAGANNADDQVGWFLVFGSGPRAVNEINRRTTQRNYVADVADETVNAKKARMFAFNLKTKALEVSVINVAQDNAVVPQDNAFVGGVNAMDWNRDFADDSIYFGTITGTQAEPTGSLMRGRITLNGETLSFDFSVMLNMGKPVTARPTTVIDYQGDNWVFAGTGRFYTRNDANTLASNNQFVGIMEAGLATGDSHASGVGKTTFTLSQL